MTRYAPPFTLDYAMLGKAADIARTANPPQPLRGIGPLFQGGVWRCGACGASDVVAASFAAG